MLASLVARSRRSAHRAALALASLALAAGLAVAADEAPVPAPSATPRDACPLGSIGGAAPDPGEQDEPVRAPKKQAWEAERGGTVAARPYVRARLAGWPTRALVNPASLPTTDRAFLERLARDTWHGMIALTDRENGLPVDHVVFGQDALDGPDARVGDYTNITNVGLHLVAVVAAADAGITSREDAAARLARVLGTLEGLERHQGFFFNYYDTTSLERTSAFLSFVDLSWLTTGLIVVRNAFPELAPRASTLIDAMDFGFFYDPKLNQMSHGYYVHRGARSRYHYGVLYTEARLGTLIAIGKGDAPEALWWGMVRTYPPDCAGQSLVPQRWERKTIRGHVVESGRYEWGGLAYVPSWGGSMFEALMPTLVLDERAHAPRSLGKNDQIHSAVQRRYAAEVLGYPVWGLSPSAVPRGTYGEFGVKVLGARGYGGGAVTPHASALALAFEPAEATANLRRLAERYDLYGEYGFYDAVEPLGGTVARTQLALDQAMLFIAVGNHLSDGAVRRRFTADPIIQRALPVIGVEDFFD